jgi:hypothetical protein
MYVSSFDLRILFDLSFPLTRLQCFPNVTTVEKLERKLESESERADAMELVNIECQRELHDVKGKLQLLETAWKEKKSGGGESRGTMLFYVTTYVSLAEEQLVSMRSRIQDSSLAKFHTISFLRVLGVSRAKAPLFVLSWTKYKLNTLQDRSYDIKDLAFDLTDGLVFYEVMTLVFPNLASATFWTNYHAFLPLLPRERMHMVMVASEKLGLMIEGLLSIEDLLTAQTNDLQFLLMSRIMQADPIFTLTSKSLPSDLIMAFLEPEEIVNKFKAGNYQDYEIPKKFELLKNGLKDAMDQMTECTKNMELQEAEYRDKINDVLEVQQNIINTRLLSGSPLNLSYGRLDTVNPAEDPAANAVPQAARLLQIEDFVDLALSPDEFERVLQICVMNQLALRKVMSLYAGRLGSGDFTQIACGELIKLLVDGRVLSKPFPTELLNLLSTVHGETITVPGHGSDFVAFDERHHDVKFQFAQFLQVLVRVTTLWPPSTNAEHGFSWQFDHLVHQCMEIPTAPADGRSFQHVALPTF